MNSNLELEIKYLPAIGLVNGEVDFFWSDATRPLTQIDTILIHSMYNPYLNGDEKYSAKACRDLLSSLGLSTHLYLNRVGQIFQSVDDCRIAWQAGKSKMPDPDNRYGVNAFSLGIELIGDEESGFTEEQYQSLVGLVAQIINQLPIENILGHRDVATAEVRDDPKTDPWNFNWEQFLIALKTVVGEERYQKLKLLGKN